MAKCIVTGIAGFVGSHIADRLLADGHYVVGIDDLSIGQKQNVPFAVDFCFEDIIDIGMRTLQGVDVIFHCAAISRTPPAVKNPSKCIFVNVYGTAILLERARLAGVPRIVVSSSNVVYGGPTAYRESKLAAEGLCKVYNELYGQSVIVLRYSNVYGSRLKKGDCAVFASLRDSKEKKGYIEITGDGNQTRDFAHVSDIVEGNIL